MSASEKNKKSKKGIGSRIWYFFNSLKLTLFTLFSLASTSIIGTVVQQNEERRVYLMEYGEKWTDIIYQFKLNDMYHSEWFAALLGLLILNILVCTIERFPPKWRVVLANKPNFNPSFIDKLSTRKVFTVEDDAETVKERLRKIFKKKRYKFVSDESGEGYAVYGWRGRIGRFGSDFVHISLFVIIAGAIVGSVYGYKDFKVVTVGGGVSVKEADFTLRLDKFWIDYYETGQIRQYNSILTVLEEGKEVLSKQIWVNEPLLYKGIRFYQSSWGKHWRKIKTARMAFWPDGKEENEVVFMVGWEEKTKVPGTDYTVHLTGYVADFAVDEKSKSIFSKSIEPENPAINVTIYRGEKKISSRWIFQKYPDFYKVLPDSNDNFVFKAYRSVLFSGISVNKDPGTNWVWLGCSIMGLGVYMAFFIFYRRVWINIRSVGNSTEVKIGAMINKNQLAIEKDLEDIAKALAGSGK